MNRIKIILHALTQFFGACICVTINSKETTSDWANRYKKAWPKRWIDRLFSLFGQEEHCATSVENGIFAVIQYAAAHGVQLQMVETPVAYAVPTPTKEDPEVRKIIKRAVASKCGGVIK